MKAPFIPPWSASNLTLKAGSSSPCSWLWRESAGLVFHSPRTKILLKSQIWTLTEALSILQALIWVVCCVLCTDFDIHHHSTGHLPRWIEPHTTLWRAPSKVSGTILDSTSGTALYGHSRGLRRLWEYGTWLLLPCSHMSHHTVSAEDKSPPHTHTQVTYMELSWHSELTSEGQPSLKDTQWLLWVS